MISSTTPRVAILGAGIAGASAARALVNSGYPVVVHDKGRVSGGRSATREREGDHFDHGAQYFTGRDPLFLAQIEAWARGGVVAEWRPRLIAIAADGSRSTPSAESRWVGVPGMNRLAANLLDGVEVRCSSRVIAVDLRDRAWWLTLADGNVDGPYAALLCTLPAPQAVALLPDLAIARSADVVEFAPCWALLLEFAEALDTGFDAAFVNCGPLSWVARDSSKPGRPDVERWVAHAGPQYSREHLEAGADAVTAELTGAFFDTLGIPARPLKRTLIHRWRYALAQPPLHAGALTDASVRLALGGDWCNGSRIEGAWSSGQVMARHAIEWVSSAR